MARVKQTQKQMTNLLKEINELSVNNSQIECKLTGTLHRQFKAWGFFCIGSTNLVVKTISAQRSSSKCKN